MNRSRRQSVSVTMTALLLSMPIVVAAPATDPCLQPSVEAVGTIPDLPPLEDCLPIPAPDPSALAPTGPEVDADNLTSQLRLGESEPSLNQSAENYVWFERVPGIPSRAMAEEVSYVRGESLRFHPDAPMPVRAFVLLAWLDHEFPAFGSPAPFTLVDRSEGRHIAIDDPSALDGRENAVESIPLGASTFYTLGSFESVRLQDRPMVVSFLETPGWTSSNQTVETSNGTIVQEMDRYNARLAVDYGGANHVGQGVLYNRHWLLSLGLDSPLFRHQDGTELPATLHQLHYLVRPVHFSTIYTFDAGSEGFGTETDRFYSDVNRDAANGNVRVWVDRRDTEDELFRRTLDAPWTTSTSFTVTSRWWTTQKGHWQGAFPLFLAASSATRLWTHANVIGIYYGSTHQTTSDAEYRLVYRDESGVLRRDVPVTLSANTEYHLFIDYSATTHVLTLKIRSAADVDLASTTYTTGTASGDGFTVNKLGIASYGQGAEFSTVTIGWVDDISVTSGASSTFSDDFSVGPLSSKWQIVNPSWVIESQELSGTALQGGGEAWIYETTATSLSRPFTVEFDMTFQSTPPDVGKHGGMMIATTANSRWTANGYTVDWLDVVGRYRLLRWDSGSVISYAEFNPPAPLQPVQAGTWYHWKIDFGVASVTLTVGGTIVGSLTDSAYASSLRLGLWSYGNSGGANNHIHYDNVLITNPTPGGNNPPVACFSLTPTSGTTSTVFNVDSSCSSDDQTSLSSLQVRWDWENDGWDTAFSTVKTASKQYSTSGQRTIKLEVKDGNGATSQTTKTVLVNNPPTACFTVTPTSGNTSTVFTADASCSNDDQTPTSSLQVRWDWDYDGNWDTTFTTTKTDSHQYANAGNKIVAMQVKDTHGATSLTTRSIAVNNCNFEDVHDKGLLIASIQSGGGAYWVEVYSRVFLVIRHHDTVACNNDEVLINVRQSPSIDAKGASDFRQSWSSFKLTVAGTINQVPWTSESITKTSGTGRIEDHSNDPNEGQVNVIWSYLQGTVHSAQFSAWWSVSAGSCYAINLAVMSHASGQPSQHPPFFVNTGGTCPGASGGGGGGGGGGTGLDKPSETHA